MTKSVLPKIVQSVLDNKSSNTVALIKESLDTKLAEKIVNYKEAVKESYLKEQDVLAKLGEIVKRKQRSSVKFQDGSSMAVDVFTAQALLATFNALKQQQAKEKFVRMANNNKFDFMKIANFAFKNTKVGI